MNCNNDLKPCPFCKCKNIYYYEDIREDSSCALVHYSFIECLGCFIRFEACSPEEWNNRPDINLNDNIDTPWPVYEILSRLCDATEHLLNDHDCDVHGYEGYSIALKEGRKLLENYER